MPDGESAVLENVYILDWNESEVENTIYRLVFDDYEIIRRTGIMQLYAASSSAQKVCLAKDAKVLWLEWYDGEDYYDYYFFLSSTNFVYRDPK